MKNILILLLLITYGQTYSQSYDDCLYKYKKDLLPQSKISSEDEGKNFILIKNNFPNYNLVDTNSYSLIWYEFLRAPTKTELANYYDSLKLYRKNVILGNFNGNGYYKTRTKPWIINDSLEIHESGVYKIKKKKISKNNIVLYFKPIFDPPITEFTSFEKDIKKGCNIFSAYSSQLVNGAVRLDVGCTPIFDSTYLFKQKFTVKYSRIDLLGTLWFSFYTSKNEKIEYAFYGDIENDYNYNGIGIKSVMKLFYRESAISAINKKLSEIKNNNLALLNSIGNFDKITIDTAIFDYTTNDIILKYNKGKDTIIKFIEVPNVWIKGNFNVALYKKDCIDQIAKNFAELKLPVSSKNDPATINNLLTVISKSPKWSNYTIQKIILTEYSDWKQYRDKWGIAIEGRALFVDVYVKDNTTNKCYLEKDVWFNQRYDILQGYIYEIEVLSYPDNLAPYPCNLK